jgi:hypothetical protein
VLLLIAWLAVTSSEFAAHPAEPALQTAPVRPNLTHPKARLFRTVLRQAAVQGPNFNGHYRLARWGCGTNCIEWAVIDLRDGRVWFAPDPAASCWPLYATEPEVVPDWFEVRVDSSLFYLHQCETLGLTSDRTFDTRYVYVWRKGKPQLLRKETLRTQR